MNLERGAGFKAKNQLHFCTLASNKKGITFIIASEKANTLWILTKDVRNFCTHTHTQKKSRELFKQPVKHEILHVCWENSVMKMSVVPIWIYRFKAVIANIPVLLGGELLIPKFTVHTNDCKWSRPSKMVPGPDPLNGKTYYQVLEMKYDCGNQNRQTDL